MAFLGFEFDHKFAFSLGGFGLNNEVVVTPKYTQITVVSHLPWAEFVCFLELFDLLAEHLFALFAGKDHLRCFLQLMVLSLLVAIWTVEPLSAAWSSN